MEEQGVTHTIQAPATAQVAGALENTVHSQIMPVVSKNHRLKCLVLEACRKVVVGVGVAVGVVVLAVLEGLHVLTGKHNEL